MKERTRQELVSLLWDGASTLPNESKVRVSNRDWKAILLGFDDEFLCKGESIIAKGQSLGVGVMQVTFSKKFQVSP